MHGNPHLHTGLGIVTQGTRHMTAKQKRTEAFGVVLRVYRQERGLTQEQLSERVDVVRSYMCTLESGKKQPSLDMVLLLVPNCKSFGHNF